MEDSKRLRQHAKCFRLEYPNYTKRKWLLAMWERVWGVDYKTQKKLVKKLGEGMLDCEEENKVYNYTCTKQVHLYMGVLHSVYEHTCTCMV